MRTTALFAVAISLAVVESGATVGPTAAGPTQTRSVTCESRIQVIPRHGKPLTQEMRRHAVEIGGVFFLGARDYVDSPRSEFEARPGRTAPVKTPYLVPSGPPVTVTLATRSVPHTDAEVGLDQAPYKVRADAVTLEPCPPEAEVAGRRVGRYTTFNAGFRVDGPQCLRLEVQADDEASPDRGRISLKHSTCR